MQKLKKKYKFQSAKWSGRTGIRQGDLLTVTQVRENKVYFIVTPDDGYGETCLHLNEFKEAVKKDAE